MKDDFIGEKILTSKGSFLEIKESYKKGGRKRYIAECSVCSEDKELFPYGSINAPKYNFQKGNIPCGCSSFKKWSKEQWTVKLKRVCEEKGYIFNSFVGEWKGGSTKVSLTSTETGNTWNTNSIEKIISGQGDPKYPHYTKQRKPDTYYTDMFESTGRYPEGTVFKRNNTTKDKMGCYSYWDVECPVCKEDFYSKSGFGYTFTCSNVSLRKGARPCRCYKGYSYSKEEREIYLRHICKNENLTFKSFENEWKGQFTNFYWLCSEGHNCKTSIDNFLDGVRCPRCYHNIPRCKNGFYKTRTDEEDTLYVVKYFSENKEFIKVGRTFLSTKYPRVEELRRIFEMDSYSELLKVSGKHEDIWNLEKDILDYFRDDHRFYFDKPIKGHTECLVSSIQQDLLNHILSLINENDKFTIIGD